MIVCALGIHLADVRFFFFFSFLSFASLAPSLQECRAIFRKVVVPRNQIMEVEVVPSRQAASSFYGSQTPLVGGATPAHGGFGGQTPGHEMGGSQTPAHRGSMTPSHRTPSRDGGHDVWSAQTPAHRQEGIPEEENEPDDFRGMMGMDSAQTPMNPITPGGVPQTPRTPGTGLQTPHAGGDPYARVPATPATPFTPGGAAGAYDEDDEEKEAEAPKVTGLFTDPGFVGCYVLLRGGPAVGIITRIEAGGAKVHVRGEAGAESGVYTQGDLAPVLPGANDKALFLDASKNRATTPSGAFQPVSIFSLNQKGAITEAITGDGDLHELTQLCKAAEVAPNDDDEEAEKPSKKKGKKSKK